MSEILILPCKWVTLSNGLGTTAYGVQLELLSKVSFELQCNHGALLMIHPFPVNVRDQAYY